MKTRMEYEMNIVMPRLGDIGEEIEEVELEPIEVPMVVPEPEEVPV